MMYKPFEKLFEELQDTTSRLRKERLVAEFVHDYPELEQDLTTIFETLDNRYPIGWTFTPRDSDKKEVEWQSFTEIIHFLAKAPSLDGATTSAMERMVSPYGKFIVPIVNRTLKLGIGKSLLVKDMLTPMLAKKYEGGLLYQDVFVTEKLDGNRCIAHYDDGWKFTSRSGKPLNVSFDMTGLDPDFIYDGEIMSIEQTTRSIRRTEALLNFNVIKLQTGDEQLLFNEASGLINQKGSTNKHLIYNIFDIVSYNMEYALRRSLLDSKKQFISANIRIIPTLYVGTNTDVVDKLLDAVVDMGGEGLMLNSARRHYENKRTDALLKYKKVKRIDMIVTDTFLGKGKYEGLVGGLICYLITDDKTIISCDVGSGLSDTQRVQWALDPSKIVGRTVEIGYHEMTQSKDKRGTNNYSLRFPRLISVREIGKDPSFF